MVPTGSRGKDEDSPSHTEQRTGVSPRQGGGGEIDDDLPASEPSKGWGEKLKNFYLGLFNGISLLLWM
jgi:hypothetical protein